MTGSTGWSIRPSYDLETMRRLAVANFPDSSILDLPERGAGAREPGHQRTCRNVESAGSLGKGQPLDGDKMKRGALLFRQVHECAPNLGETRSALCSRSVSSASWW